MLEHFIHYFHRINEVFKDINFGFFVEILVNLIILILICKFLDMLETKYKNKITSSHADSQIVKIVPVVNKILKFIVFFIILASFLQTHGYSVSSLIAGFGITGLAVGLAANSALANIFGTVSVISDKSFQVGDYIQFGNYEGTVEDINMRSTKIRTIDNALTVIPNSMISNDAIINISAARKKRIFEIIGISYNTSNEKLKTAVKIIEEILENTGSVAKDYMVNIDKLDKSSINIRINAYVQTNILSDYLKTKESILLEIINKFHQEGIEFAIPSQTVYIAGTRE